MKKPIGAGGTEGGIGRFFIGLTLLVVGGYLFIYFKLRPMTAFELISILVLMIGGLGMFLSSLRNFSRMLDEYEEQHP